jgi:alkylation response protein AidB-like acyl-CoA dehydrogenase
MNQIFRPANARDAQIIARELAHEWRATSVERDRAGGTAKAERDALRKSGLLSLIIPTEYGGWGADWPTAIEVIREVAHGDGSLGHLYGYHTASVPMIELFASPLQKEELYQRIAHGNIWVGNASSENNSHVLDWRVSAIPTGDGGYTLNGTKHFCSGAKDSGLLLVFAVTRGSEDTEGAIIAAAIPSDREGIRINDDWNAIGMRQTDSGSTEFDNVVVRPEEILGSPNSVIEAFATGGRGSLWTPVAQLVFSAVYLGIARAALEEAADYTRTQTRPWTPAGVGRATADPYTIRTYGELAVQLQGAEAALREAAHALQEAWSEADAASIPAVRGALMVTVSGVKVLATQAALEITSKVFEVMGARSTHPRYGHDRFWRNVRTHTLHDPVAYKLYDVGNHTLNGAHPTPGFTS